jgi:D-alanyl-lipoteichoic acid acyltransferase DltB (MBOAT superfamily)
LPGLSLPDQPGKVLRLGPTGSKLLICGLGFTLLYVVSGGVWAVLTLFFTTTASYRLARWVHSRPADRAQKLIARTAVPCTFLLLVFLNVIGLIGTLTGAQSSILSGATTAFIALPFYLMAEAAFIVDVAEKRMVLPSFLDFLAYISLPFKLLAGPLESPRLLGQLQEFRFRIRGSRLLVAWTWLAMGAFMKFVIANRLDPARHLILTDPIPSFLTAAVFELKFYFDFAGYSFMAYGFALAAGMRISQNFNQPF